MSVEVVRVQSGNKRRLAHRRARFEQGGVAGQETPEAVPIKAVPPIEAVPPESVPHLVSPRTAVPATKPLIEYGKGNVKT